MIRFHRSPVPALAMTGLLAGCGSVQHAADPPALDNTAWTLSALPGQDLVAGSPVTLRFEGGRVSGTDGCNRYSGPYSVKGAELEVAPQLASTQMACPPAVAQQAQAFIAALTGSGKYRLANGQLELLAADGTLRATLTRQSESLAGTAWRVTGINNGKQAVVSVLAGSSPTLAFAADGGISGSAGCNRFTSRYTADGTRVTFAPPASTRKMCAEPEGVMAQEQMFLAALETVAAARVDGDRLELRTADGALALTATRDGGG